MNNKFKYQKRIISTKVLTPEEESLLEAFIEEALNAYNEEDREYFVLSMHRNHQDITFFAKEDQKRVLDIFDILIKDTKKHAELVEHVVKLCE